MSLPANTLRIAVMAPSDRAYVRGTWMGGHKFHSAASARLPWAQYKAGRDGRAIDALLARDDVQLLGAYAGDRIAGWLAYTPGKRVSTVHWAFTRIRLDEERFRRKGVMTRLLEAADLGSRLAFTMKGERSRFRRSRRDRSPDAPRNDLGVVTLDVPIVAWLRGRGVTASYVEIGEWLR